MGTDGDDNVGEIADNLDEWKTTVEELSDDPDADLNRNTLGKLTSALEQASDAADELEDAQES